MGFAFEYDPRNGHQSEKRAAQSIKPQFHLPKIIACTSAVLRTG